MIKWTASAVIVVGIVIVAHVAVCSSAAADDQDDQQRQQHQEMEWIKFKETHKKTYANEREEAKRKILFSQTDRLIKEHNNKQAANKAGWNMAHNKFSDMTFEEKQESLGLSASASSVNDITPPEASAKNGRFARSLLQATAPSVDLRSDICMPPVRDQGQCGSCWAFATLPPLEYAHCKNTGTLLDLSEQQLVDCSPYDKGCKGGFYTNAWSYLKNYATYSTTEAAYPYSSGASKLNGTCRAANTTTTMPKTSMTTLTYSKIASDSSAIMSAVSTYGPIAVAFYVDNNFYSYSSGVYTTEYCRTMTPPDSINHGVVIVGYGAESNGVPFWIVRNSWGTGWGLAGYVKYLRGANQCNIETKAYYVTL